MVKSIGWGSGLSKAKSMYIVLTYLFCSVSVFNENKVTYNYDFLSIYF